MSGQIIEVQLRSTSGVVQTLRVTEVVSIDGKPYNHNESDDIQTCYQAIRNLEGRLDEQGSQVAILLQTLLNPASEGT